MTLQDIVKILNLNPVFKSASDSQKITAINQYLNDIDETTLYDSTPAYFPNKPVKFYTETYKLVQDILRETLLGNEVQSLIEYSLLDHSLDNPYEAEFLTTIKDDDWVFKLSPVVRYKVKYPITHGNIPNYENDPTEKVFSISFRPTFKIGLPNITTFPITFIPTYKLGVPQTVTQNFQLQMTSTYKVTDLDQPSTLAVGYSATYLVW